VLAEDDRTAARALRDKYGVRYVLMSDQLVLQYPSVRLRPFAARPGCDSVSCESDTRRDARGLRVGGYPLLLELGREAPQTD